MMVHAAAAAHRVTAWISRRPLLAGFVTLVTVVTIGLGIVTYAVHVVRESTKQNQQNIAALTDQAARLKALAVEGVKAKTALCAYRSDLGRRIDESKAFLRHPPKEILGIKVTPAVIASVKSTLTNQQATYASYTGLVCARAEAPKPPPSRAT